MRICERALSDRGTMPRRSLSISESVAAVRRSYNEANQRCLHAVHTQIGEMELVRSKIYQLETTHRQKLAQYDKFI